MSSPYYDKVDIDIKYREFEKLLKETARNMAKGVAETIKPTDDTNEFAVGYNYRLAMAGIYNFSPALVIVDGITPNELPLGYDVIVSRNSDGWKVESLIAMPEYDDSELVEKYNQIFESVANKVDKVEGKSLSTNDFTSTHKSAVEKIVSNGDGKMFLSNDGTYKKAGSGSGSGSYNVNQKAPLDNGYYDLDSAISVVSSDEDIEEENVFGMVITFESSPNVWTDYLFTSKSISELGNADNWIEKSVRNVVKSIDLYKGVDKTILTPDANGNIILEIPDVVVDDALDQGSANPISNNAVYAEFARQDAKFGTEIIANELGDGLYTVSLLDSNGEIISTTSTISGGGGSGSGSTASTRVVLTKVSDNPTVKSGDEVKLTYLYDQIDTESQSSTGNSATATITISRGATSNSYTKILTPGATDTIDVTEYLAVGTSTVRVRIVTNDEAQQVSTISWAVTVVQLKLESSYNIATKYTRGETVRIPYSLTGTGSKTLKLYVDGVLAEDKVITTSSSTGTFTYDTSKIGHGTHSFQLVAQLEVNESLTILSNSIYFGVIITESARTTPVIGIKVDFPDGSIILAGETLYQPVRQYESYDIVYSVYNPTTSTTSTAIKVGSDTVSQANVLFVRTSVSNRSVLQGDLESSITAGSTVLNFITRVNGLDIDIAEPTDGIVLRLNANNKTNADADKDQWTSLGVTSKLENFTWVGNGWLNGALRHTDKAKTTINIKPLTPTIAPNNAVSIEFKFKVSNLISDTQALISCVDSANIGFVITGQEAKMITRGGSEVVTKFSTDEVYNVAFVSFPIAGSDATEYDTIHSGMLYLYVNGILSGGVKKGSSDSLYQNIETPITIGTNNMAILDLYSVKVFSKALTDTEMLNTYLTSISNTDTLLDKFLENNILDVNGNISIENLPNNLPYMIITGVQENGVATVMQAAVNNNKDTKYDIDEILYVNPSKPSKNFKAVGGCIRLQGTSSLAYPIKNYRIYFTNTKKEKAVLSIGVDAQGLGGVIDENSKYSFKDATSTQKAAVPVDCFCLKADYAESSSSHNTGTAVIVHEVLNSAQDLTPVQKNVSSSYKYDVRTTIDGFPIVLFYRATKNDTPIFLSKFNFNNDKSTEDVFGFKEIPGYHDADWLANKFGGVNPTECWEFLNNDYPMGMFLDADFDSKDTNGVPNWTKVFEARYIHDEDLVDQFEAGTLKPTRLETLVKWVNSTASNPTKFKNELANYFDVKHLCDYYMITDMLGAVDQRVKNMMMGFWYNPDVDKVLAYMIFYDNDTILGVRNDGKLKYDWTIDETTIDPELSTSSRPVYAFAGHDSVLWKNLRSQFATELGDAYRRLRAKMTNDYIFSIYDTAQSQKFSERLYNIDAINKYILPATKGIEVVQNGITSYQTYDYLEAMQGSRLSHRHYWLINRLNFFDAKYNTGAYRSTDINWKGNSASGAKVTAVASRDYYFAFTRESAVQAQQFVKAGGTFTYTYNQEANIGTIFHLYGGDWMQKLDLSYWGGFTSLSLPKLKVLEELILGNVTKTYTLPTIAIGDSLPLLKKIDITNYTMLSILDLSGCPSLVEVVARGCTSLSNITLAGGAPITKLTLPSNYKNLSLAGLPSLTNAGLVFENLGNLESANITSCPLFNNNTFLATLMATESSIKRYLRLDIGTVKGNGDLLKNLASGNYGGVTATGSFSQDTINLIGTYEMTSWLDETLLNSYRTKFPELVIKQVPYTVISYPTTVADPQKLTNLDNNTGYGTGKAYEVSGHVKKILDLREYVMVKRNGLNGIVYCKVDRNPKPTDSNVKFQDGFNNIESAQAKHCIHEPRFYYKGVNDYVNKKNYMVWAWTEDGLPPAKPKVVTYDRAYINDFKTTDTYANSKATDVSNIALSNILYDSYKIEIPSGAKKVRVQLPISTGEPALGVVFSTDTSIVSTYESTDPDDLIVMGMYTVLDVPQGAKYINFSLPKSYLDTVKLLFSFSDNIIDIEDLWIESKETFISSHPDTIYNSSFLNTNFASSNQDIKNIPSAFVDPASKLLSTTSSLSPRKLDTHFDLIRAVQINTLYNLGYCKYGRFDLHNIIANDDGFTVNKVVSTNSFGSNNVYKFSLDIDSVKNPNDPNRSYLKYNDNYYSVYYGRFMGYVYLFNTNKGGRRTFYRGSRNSQVNFNYGTGYSTTVGYGKTFVNETYMSALPVYKTANESVSTYISTKHRLPIVRLTGENDPVKLFGEVLTPPVDMATPINGMYRDNTDSATNPGILISFGEFELGNATLISNSQEFINYPAPTSIRYRYEYDDTKI